MNLPPSEVRQMTVGEIWAIIWARTRHQTRESELAEMYAELKEATQE